MKRTLALALVTLACAGCSPIGPDYERPEIELPQNWKSLPGANPALWKPATPADDVPKDKWWKAFNDKMLEDLIEQCLTNNNTLQVSLARLDQAIAQSEARGAALLPSLNLGATATRVRTSENRPTNTYTSVNASTTQNDFRPVAVMTYEIDWLGKVRRDVEASSNTAAQAAADTENVRLLLTAQLASAYFLMRQYDEEIRILSNIVAIQKKLLDLIQKRYDLGAAGRTELSQQMALSESSGAQLEMLRSLRNVQENLIATLTGTPAALFSIAPGRLPNQPPVFPVSLPSSLLERRPDVAAAERAMAAANAQVGVAKAAFFPSLLIAPTFLGADSTNIANLLSVPSIIWTLGVTATQTLFDGGRTSANYRFAQAGYRATAAGYRQTITVAIQETQDAMSSVQQLERARNKQDEAVRNLDKAYQISAIRYREGLDTAQTLALIQQNQLTAQRIKWQMHGGQFLANIALVKALGGGWDGYRDLKPELSTDNKK
ncbi:efflux transporter outer membrane subunit [Alcaligenaceae bacterium LF4-65]|jgi:NodT family efflux transporter outer membrane factor (OMF) lipoprotein|uniref:Efflux transporter outer membrane subunit n=1 Tax=Zwartia hollandica TaxID=324606 RepID=A0A953NCY8_9BURK|nr:efflux transporter outer membrane subunit [Zwartia hollandica]MBZ1350941.1 efflux transporter outer membrane subunit [Zwartia hollandica]